MVHKIVPLQGWMDENQSDGLNKTENYQNLIGKFLHLINIIGIPWWPFWKTRPFPKKLSEFLTDKGHEFIIWKKKWLAYYKFIILLQIFNFIRCLTSFFMDARDSLVNLGDLAALVGEDAFFMRCILVIMYSFSTLAITQFCLVGFNDDLQLKSYYYWNKVETQNVDYIKKWHHRLSRFSAFAIPVNSILVISFFSLGLKMHLLKGFLIWSPINILSIIFVCGFVFTALCWFVFLCIILQNSLMAIFEDLEQITCRSKVPSEEYFKIKKCFETHNDLTELVCCLNTSCKNYIALAYAHFIPIICFVAYQVVWSELDILMRTVLSSWGVLLFGYILMLSFAAATVSDAAHKPFLTLLKISGMENFPKNDLTICHFCQKLSGPAIGFTAADMFVITKGTILTVISVLSSYFMILLQFSASGATTSNTNVTCSVPV